MKSLDVVVLFLIIIYVFLNSFTSIMPNDPVFQKIMAGLVILGALLIIFKTLKREIKH
ncbi:MULTISPECIES: hypothetical protein [Nosocomiicoccus]|uniref:Uncharacterized protein n=1 Tax=Nosocomiicoccus massiliensis TaxID=1232430 RepID=A0AAF0YNH9_9STAP|nr:MULTISPECIES: hypothetical protein [Nosocomiicoccus]WOS96744.1 hypothetical protein CJ229_003080 [Nosocomiicoccus massiliensis]